MGESDFHELLHAAEQLSAEVEGSGDLPKVVRNLRQVLDASTELWSKVTQSGAQDIQAHVLLGSKGVDLPQITHKLDALSSRKTFEPLEPIPETDVKGFIKNETENALLSVIEKTHQRCFKQIHKWQFRHVVSDWKQHKMKILNSLLSMSDEYFNDPQQPEISMTSDIVNPGVRSRLSSQEMAYAKQITEYNQVVVKGAIRPSLIEKLSRVAEGFNDKKVNDLWEMVRYMSEIPPRATKDPLELRSMPVVQRTLISQARKYLEERYKTYMTSVVMGNLKNARRGGVPGILPLVRSFVAVQVPSGTLGLEDGLVEGQPFWPQIYYCLRCGNVGAALECARNAGPGLAEFSSLLEQLQSSKTGYLSSRLESVIKVNYRTVIKGSTDPFKSEDFGTVMYTPCPGVRNPPPEDNHCTGGQKVIMEATAHPKHVLHKRVAVYCVVGGCDVNEEHTKVAKSADDYLWLKLCQIRDEDKSAKSTQKSDKLLYSHLQSLILEEYGEKHYNAASQPHVYFQMLILTGQFEAAIEFLARVEKFNVHAVHIALAMNELNLLGIPKDPNASVLSVEPNDKPPARRLNFARLVMLYVKKFESTDPKEALQYFYFLRNIKSSSGQNFFITCVSELAMQSRDFDLILGQLEPTGRRIPGLIDSFHGVQANPSVITSKVAADCEKKGFYEDAIRLYDLANNHEKVLQLISVLLAQVVSQPSRAGSPKNRLQEIAENIAARYKAQQVNCSPDTASAFFMLCDLLKFFDYYHAQEYQLALEVISKTRIIPMAMEEVEERVNNFTLLGEEICRNIPDVLLATMNILYTQYNKIRGGDANTTVTARLEDKTLAYLREKARAITSFAGTVPYRMPGDTNSRLVQMEILMN